MAADHLMLLLSLISSFSIINCQTTQYNTEQQILLQIKKEFGNPPTLASIWDTSTRHRNWTGIKCTNGSVTRLHLNNYNITEPIPSAICNLKNLIVLDLSYNYLPGTFPTVLYNCTKLQYLDICKNSFIGPIPPTVNQLSNQLYYLSLSANNFTGDIPSSIGQLSALQHLLLDNNLLNGTFPAELGNLSNLEILFFANNMIQGEIPSTISSLRSLCGLDLCNNRLVGKIPEAIGSLSSLKHLKLGNNQLSGSIPSQMVNLTRSLIFLDLSSNQLSGEIPGTISSLGQLISLDLSNNQLTGKIPTAIGLMPNLSVLELQNNQLYGPLPPELGRNLKFTSLNLSFNQLSGEIPALLQNEIFSQSFLSNRNLCSWSKSLPNIASCDHPKKLSSLLHILLFIFAALFSLALATVGVFVIRAQRRRRRKHNGNLPSLRELTTFHSVEISDLDIVEKLIDDNLIGSGGGGMVYRITLNTESGQIAAVKKMWNSRKLDARLEKEFLAEVQILGLIRHANIVKLLGCLTSSNSKLLIYEYVENGSLNQWLHHQTDPTRSGSLRALDWPTRLRIAVGAAKGLCYLHHDCSPPIVHRDVKSANILLDSVFHAKIADFGLARKLIKAGEPESVSAMAGSFGYMAPECGWLRKVNQKMDVYSFGVVILELITGRKASDGGEEGNLADWVWRHFQETGTVGDAIADEIREPSYVEEIEAVLKLGIICTGTLPSDRPSMKDVLRVLLRIARTQIRDIGEDET